MKNKEVEYDFKGIIHKIRPDTNKDLLYLDYITISKNLIDNDSNNNMKIYIGEKDNNISPLKFKIGDEIINTKNNKKGTISDQDKDDLRFQNLIEYENGSIEWVETCDIKIIEDDNNYNFKESGMAVGVPSGQIIYLNERQILYLKSKNIIKWTEFSNDNNGNSIKLNSLTFNDENYNDIIKMINGL
jgi:hypothetical protein